MEANLKNSINTNGKESAVEHKKNKQKNSILKELYKGTPMMISELSEKLLISIPSLTALVEELVSENWLVSEEIDNNKQGRKPKTFSVNSKYNYILIVDINTHQTNVYILNLQNKIIYQEHLALKLTNDPDFYDQIIEVIKGIIDLKKQEYNIIGIGVSIPGLVNKSTGINRTYPNLNINDKSLSQKISEKLKMPVYTLNDSKAAAYGESVFGHGQNLKHVLSINVDWGIGLGIVINNQIFNGSSGFAGELGHIQVKPDGVLCTCGKVGCLDTITSASALLKAVKEGLLNGQASILSKYKSDLDQINLEMVIDAANNGDGFAIDIIYNIGIELGKGLSIAVHLFNPQIIVIDGELSKAGKLIVNPVEHAIQRHCLPDFKEDLTIEVTNLGDMAKILGVNAFVINKILKNS